MIEHAIKFPERDQAERSDQGEKRDLVAGKNDAQRDRPEDKRAGETKNKNRAPVTVLRRLARASRPCAAQSEMISAKASADGCSTRIVILPGKKQDDCATPAVIYSQRREQNDAGAREKPTRTWPLAGRSPNPRSRQRRRADQVLKTSICGTDVHIYNWDAWAQKTIPVPMVIGHEFVGVIDQVGDRRPWFCTRRYCHRRRPHRLRALPELPGRPAASLPEHDRASA